MTTAEQLDLIDKMMMETEDHIREMRFLAASGDGDTADLNRLIRYQEELHRKLRDMRVYFTPNPADLDR